MTVTSPARPQHQATQAADVVVGAGRVAGSPRTWPGDQTQTAEQLAHEWATDPRWAGVRRDWSAEDVLARRCRLLFLDARRAQELAPAVGAILHEETGVDPQVQAFQQLARSYLELPT